MALKGQKYSIETRQKISKNHADVSGSNNPRWKGGFYRHRGYIYRYAPDHPNRTAVGYVMEHRLVMETKLGRFLDKKEVVHHLNHIKDDNREENLMLVNSSTHAVIHHTGNQDRRGISKCLPYTKEIMDLSYQGTSQRKIAQILANEGINLNYKTIGYFLRQIEKYG